MRGRENEGESGKKKRLGRIWGDENIERNVNGSFFKVPSASLVHLKT